jgi:hypothetical protein
LPLARHPRAHGLQQDFPGGKGTVYFAKEIRQFE